MHTFHSCDQWALTMAGPRDRSLKPRPPPSSSKGEGGAREMQPASIGISTSVPHWLGRKVIDTTHRQNQEEHWRDSRNEPLNETNPGLVARAVGRRGTETWPSQELLALGRVQLTAWRNQRLQGAPWLSVRSSQHPHTCLSHLSITAAHCLLPTFLAPSPTNRCSLSSPSYSSPLLVLFVCFKETPCLIFWGFISQYSREEESVIMYKVPQASRSVPSPYSRVCVLSK